MTELTTWIISNALGLLFILGLLVWAIRELSGSKHDQAVRSQILLNWRMVAVDTALACMFLLGLAAGAFSVTHADPRLVVWTLIAIPIVGMLLGLYLIWSRIQITRSGLADLAELDRKEAQDKRARAATAKTNRAIGHEAGRQEAAAEAEAAATTGPTEVTIVPAKVPLPVAVVEPLPVQIVATKPAETDKEDKP